MSKTGKRLLISTYGGSVITTCIVTMGASIFYFANRAGDLMILRPIAELLYWPARLLAVVGLDCANANLISEKINCIGLCLAIDLVTYSALIYILLWFLEKRGLHLDH